VRAAMRRAVVDFMDLLLGRAHRTPAVQETYVERGQHP
jgi:hypothetical protein